MICLVCYCVTFFACALGTVCGMGGGILIKPVLDAFGVMPVSAITFLSGCTVIAMSCWSVGRALAKGDSELEMKTTPLLAAGAALGGLAGRELFSRVAELFPDRDAAGGVQACLLLAATFATLLYTLNKDRVRSRQVRAPGVAAAIGVALGMLGAFLGIGGGPFNVAVLYCFFSMPAKKAAQNSLLIVLLSQLASTLKTVLADGAPALDPAILAGMVVLGILGSEAGRRVNRRIDNAQAARCLEAVMVLIMAINVYNIWKFMY
ncbi:MAG: sulfite exporter TauE/SafE family protein [Lawsonibacter sp.]|nr:sulfite exporter TauE/SafE family protein [Lawsonibacter sp.]